MQTRQRRRAAAVAAAVVAVHEPEGGETLTVPPRRVSRLCQSVLAKTPEGGSGRGRGLVAWMSSTLCCLRYSRARRWWEPTPGCSRYLETLRQLDPVIVACVLAGALMGAYMVA